MTNETILLVDDKPNNLEVLGELLRQEGYTVRVARSGQEALASATALIPDVIVTDLRMPKMDGLEFFKAVHPLDAELPIIFITAFGTVESAVAAMKLGAYDYLTKPLDHEKLKLVLRRALDQRRIIRENRDLRAALRTQNAFDRIVGVSQKMQKLLQLVRTLASSVANVLLQGESGTGKELVAQAIHEASPRRERRLVVVNCSALSESLLESELFGHEKGAFTGATGRKRGWFEVADGGTLLLDEIGEMSSHLQVKLLRVIQERVVERVGGTDPIRVDFRLIAATNRDLKADVAAGRFREDLYYRLSVMSLKIPPLRERREDIPLLVIRFIQQCSRREGKRVTSVSPDVMERLVQYPWPGNVRELENALERAVVVAESEQLTLAMLPEEIQEWSPAGRAALRPLEELTLEEMERFLIEKTLERTGGNKSQAARLLNVHRRSIYNRLKKYDTGG
ncbi:MAG: sigma-54 dependent transcriptional regulator [bacterium]|nr:sigma-54 dependent transcriptional regulator [bacterium]